MITVCNSNGLIDSIYYFLWFKEESITQSNNWILLPDTVIFKNQQPAQWYFTSKNGEILIKKDDNRTYPEIYKTFTNQSTEGQIIAMFIYPEKYNYQIKSFQINYTLTRDLRAAQESFDGQEKLCIYYMTKEMLQKFLDDPQKPPEGILQKFIMPYGEKEAIIQAAWSPSICILSKQQNYRNLYDKNYDPYERCTTFDGACVYSRNVPLQGREITNKIRNQAKMIVEKITNISFDKFTISRIILNFKLDKDNKLWFLYASSLRMLGENQVKILLEKKRNHFNNKNHNNTPLALGDNFVRPYQIKQMQTINTNHPVKLTKDFTCLNCSQTCQEKDLFDTNFYMIIDTFNDQTNYKKLTTQIQIQTPDESKKDLLVTENDKTPSRMNQNCNFQQKLNSKIKTEYLRNDLCHIPPIFIKIYPNITFEAYQQIKTNHQFINNSVKLCEKCYLHFSKKNYHISGTKPVAQQQNIRRKKDYLKNSVSSKLLNLDDIKEKFHQMNLEFENDKKFNFLISNCNGQSSQKQLRSQMDQRSHRKFQAQTSPDIFKDQELRSNNKSSSTHLLSILKNFRPQSGRQTNSSINNQITENGQKLDQILTSETQDLSDYKILSARSKPTSARIYHPSGKNKYSSQIQNLFSIQANNQEGSRNDIQEKIFQD